MTGPLSLPVAAVDISRLFYARDPNGWVRALDKSRRHGMTLVEVLHRVYLETRDDCAREAFDRGLTVARVARERLAKRKGTP